MVRGFRFPLAGLVRERGENPYLFPYHISFPTLVRLLGVTTLFSVRFAGLFCLFGCLVSFEVLLFVEGVLLVVCLGLKAVDMDKRG